MTGRRRRKREQLLNDRKDNRSPWRLKEETIDLNLQGTGFGRGHGDLSKGGLRNEFYTLLYVHLTQTDIQLVPKNEQAGTTLTSALCTILHNFVEAGQVVCNFVSGQTSNFETAFSVY